MDPEAREPEPFVLIFEGGDMDGRVIDTRSATEKEQFVAKMFLGMTKSGEVGQGTQGYSYSSILDNRVLSAIRQTELRHEQGVQVTKIHGYQSVEKTWKDGAHHVRVQYHVIDVRRDREEE